jgi:D-methionine transport system substrate-binding protein
VKRALALICCFALSLALAGCGSDDENKLVVGATAKPHAEILKVVQPILEKEGIDLEIKEFTDYVLLNPALNDGEIDANFFQHIPYLEDSNEKNKTDLVWTVKVHNEPMGVYSKKFKKIEDLPNDARVGIPNDTTNGGRALMVLEKSGVIKLKEGAGVTATDKDIAQNLKNLKIQMMDAAMLARSLDDLDACVINSNYAIEADLNPVEDSVFMEPKDSPFANVLVVRAEDKDKEAVRKLGKALQSAEVKEFLEENYEGSCVPAF